MSNKYRTHNCNELRKEHVNNDAVLSGWINKKRDHGNLLFIDLRDNYGVTQCIIDIDNKYIIVTSQKPITSIDFSLVDLKSRTKNFLIQIIDKPDDELLFALILKNLSDRQISIDEKLINFIIKRIDRSYGNISNFIYKIDELSLKKRKPIDFKLIREVLGD